MSCPDEHTRWSSEVYREEDSGEAGMRGKGFVRPPRWVLEAGVRHRPIRIPRRLVEKVRM